MFIKTLRNFENQVIPAFSQDVERIQWNDGCKICFSDGSWVICRFSGTEPLLRIAAEGNTADQVYNYIQQWQDFLNDESTISRR